MSSDSNENGTIEVVSREVETIGNGEIVLKLSLRYTPAPIEFDVHLTIGDEEKPSGNPQKVH